MSLDLPTCSTCGTCLPPPFDESVLPHRDLLTSNDPPLQNDTQSIRDCILEHDLKVSQLDRLLDDIKKAGSFVISRREEHARLAQAYRCALSPIRQLPAELLEEIFLLCVTSCYNTLSPGNPPWVFGKVCRRWRSVALSAPQLWSVTPELEPRPESDSYLQLLSTSLRLSRAFPLCLGLSVRSFEGNPIPLLNVISSHIHHCQSLEIHTDATHLPLIHRTFRGISCSLRRLNIYLSGAAETFLDFHSLSTFQLSSNIRDLALGANCWSDGAIDNGPFIHSWLKITWSNLTTFSGAHLQMQYVTDLLQSAPSLLQCSFTELKSRGTNNFTAVEHTSLRSLHLDVAEHSQLPAGLLDYITLPSLAKLSIPLVAGVAVRSLISFFTRSSYSLSTLTFTGVALDDMSPLLASLMKAPLTSLCLEFDWETSFESVHLDPLIGQPLGAKLPFLPHLQHITANCLYSLDFYELPHPGASFSFLNRLIESRLHLAKTLGTAALETVTLRCADTLTATYFFNELEGWSESPPQHGQVSYAKVRDDWLRVFRNLSKSPIQFEEKEETSLHEVILEIENFGTRNIPPMFIHRSMICDYLPLISKLPDDHFEKGDRYQLRQRASVIFERWKDVLEEYLRCPGWSMRKYDPSGFEYALSYSTVGRDYYTFRP